MIEHSTNSTIIHETSEDLDEFLLEAAMLGTPAAKLTADQQNEFFEALKQIAESDLNKGGGGGVSAIVGSVHFRIGKTIYTALKILVELKIALVTGGLGLDLAVVNAMQEARALFSRLSETELDVCTALLAVMKHRRGSGKKPIGGTEADIEGEMKACNFRVPRNLRDILVKLAGGETPVLAVDMDGGQTRYRVT